MDTSRGPDVTVLASSPYPTKGYWACKLNSASCRAWVRTFLQGVQVNNPEAPGRLEGDVLYLADILMVKIFLDAYGAYTPVHVESKNPLIQSGLWICPAVRRR